MSFRPFRRLPPWTFGSRDRADQLVCDPRSYVRAFQADGRPLWAPCLAWSPGPAELAATGDGSFTTLFGAAWLLQICDDGSWVLYQREGNEDLAVIPWDVTPPFASLTARHPSLAFDQAARPAIAWEDDAGIRLREFDEFAGAYRFIGPFGGCDPVLWNDATVNGRVPGSDVILFYLSTDRLTLRYRLQSENFETEHDHYAFSVPAILDAHELLMLRYQLKYGMHADGGEDLEGGEPQALRSLLYPAYLQDAMSGAVGNFPGAEMRVVVLVRTFATEELTGLVGNFAAAENHTVVIVRTFATEELTGTVGNFPSAENHTIVQVIPFPTEALTGVVANFPAATLDEVVIVPTFDPEELTGTVGNFAAAEYVAA